MKDDRYKVSTHKGNLLCPFCGSKPAGPWKNTWGLTMTRCSNENCCLFYFTMCLHDWNNRKYLQGRRNKEYIKSKIDKEESIYACRLN